MANAHRRVTARAVADGLLLHVSMLLPSQAASTAIQEVCELLCMLTLSIPSFTHLLARYLTLPPSYALTLSLTTPLTLCWPSIGNENGHCTWHGNYTFINGFNSDFRPLERNA